MGFDLGGWLGIFLLVWFILAPPLVVGLSERSEGAAKFVWVVLALVFSWLAVLVWALVTQKQAGRVPCLFCGEKVLAEAKVCPHCQTPGPVVTLPPEARKLSDARRAHLRRQLEAEARQRAGLAG